MYEYFAGNYRWSFAVHNALRCGAQIGEIDRALRDLRTTDEPSEDDWAAAWTGAAEAQERLARRDLDRGFRISAGERLLKASVFHITAERQLDRGERKAAAYRNSLDCYARGSELAELGFERVEVDSPDGILPGLFIPAHGAGPHPVMIFFDGFDITKEIMALTVRESFRRRGISCLTVDSPGVGEPLRLRNVPSRPDYETPAAAIIDYLETRGGCRLGPDRCDGRVARWVLRAAGRRVRDVDPLLRGVGSDPRLRRHVGPSIRIAIGDGLGAVPSAAMGDGDGHDGGGPRARQAVGPDGRPAPAHPTLPVAARGARQAGVARGRAAHVRARRLRRQGVPALHGGRGWGRTLPVR